MYLSNVMKNNSIQNYFGVTLMSCSLLSSASWNYFGKGFLKNTQKLTYKHHGQSQLARKSYSVEVPAVNSNCFNGCLKSLRNWAAAGPDGIQGFWVKKFSAFHPVLMHHYSLMLQNGSNISKWFPVGRTILIPKSSDTTISKNFRPITCLNVMYKF